MVRTRTGTSTTGTTLKSPAKPKAPTKKVKVPEKKTKGPRAPIREGPRAGSASDLQHPEQAMPNAPTKKVKVPDQKTEGPRAPIGEGPRAGSASDSQHLEQAKADTRALKAKFNKMKKFVSGIGVFDKKKKRVKSEYDIVMDEVGRAKI